MKLQHKYNKLLFVLLEKTLNNDFFKGKIYMNLFEDLPSNEFNKVLEEWISRSIDANPQIGLVCLKSHFKVNPLLELNSLKDVVDNFARNVNFPSNKFGRIFAIFSTMNSLTKDLNVCSQTYWKSVFSSLLSMKVSFKAIVCICNKKSFINLVVTLQEDDLMDEIFMEYGFYQVSKQEVPLSR